MAAEAEREQRRAARLLAHHRNLIARDDWQPGPAQIGIQTATLRAGHPIAYVRCVFDLACPAATLAAYLIDDILTTLAEWNPLYIDGRELRGVGERARVLHLRFRGPRWPVSPRDNLIYVARVDQPDGTALELSEDDDHDALPPEPGVRRMILPFASKQIVPIGDGACRYTVIWQTNPGGRIGRWLPAPLLTRAVLNDLIGECVRLRARYGAAPEVAA